MPHCTLRSIWRPRQYTCLVSQSGWLTQRYQWSRICGGFGEDADIASELTTAYIKGLQGESIGPQSVAACVKHFPGGGPQRGGDDCHMQWGAEADYPGDNWEYHLKPFRAAVNAGVR